jgi:hypothetical protein
MDNLVQPFLLITMMKIKSKSKILIKLARMHYTNIVWADMHESSLGIAAM